MTKKPEDALSWLQKEIVHSLLTSPNSSYGPKGPNEARTSEHVYSDGHSNFYRRVDQKVFESAFTGVVGITHFASVGGKGIYFKDPAAFQWATKISREVTDRDAQKNAELEEQKTKAEIKRKIRLEFPIILVTAVLSSVLTALATVVGEYAFERIKPKLDAEKVAVEVRLADLKLLADAIHEQTSLSKEVISSTQNAIQRQNDELSQLSARQSSVESVLRQINGRGGSRPKGP